MSLAPPCRIAVGIILAAGVIGGCANKPTARPSRSVPARSAILDSPFGPAPGEVPRAEAPPPQIRVMDVDFQIMRVDVPIDSVRHSAKIWNHVRAGDLDPERVEILARNGVAVGIGAGEDWPALRAILTAARARVRTDQMLARSGLPVSVEVGRIDGTESVFSSRPGQRPAGRTFDGGSKLLHVNYAVEPALAGLVSLQLSLEIRKDRGEVSWQRVGGVLQQVPLYDQFPFDHLDVILPVGPGGFVIIGPTPDSDNDYWVGQRFFSATIDGRRHDTLLVIAPEVQEATRTLAGREVGS